MCLFLFKQKTAYEMRISDWSSDVCSSELSRFRLLEVEPHSLMSAAHGKTQRAVTDLFAQSIAEAAAAGPTMVLLDEVETLAADSSEERRVGKGCVSTGRSRLSPSLYKQKSHMK